MRFALAGVLSLCFVSMAGAQQTSARPVAVPPSSTSVPTTPVGSQSSSGTAPQAVAPTPAQPRPPEVRFLVLVDPAHGGTDSGATLGIAGPEKSYTLALAMRLRAMLSAHGIHSLLTRDADVMLENDARAEIANRAHASACILLHATSSGNGVHLFTSSLAAVAQADPRRAFLPWQTVQAAYGTQSLRLESDFNAALTRQQIPVLATRTSLMPLDSMACPAVAIEVAPLDANTPLTDASYQQKILESLDEALIAWRGEWRQQP